MIVHQSQFVAHRFIGSIYAVHSLNRDYLNFSNQIMQLIVNYSTEILKPQGLPRQE